MSFLPRCMCAAEAFDSFKRHGVAILAREGEWCLEDDTIDELLKWCVDCDEEQKSNWYAWKSADRHMNPNVLQDWNRFSMNSNGNWKAEAWEGVVRGLSRANGVLAFAQILLGSFASIIKLRGDTVRRHCKAGQHLHSDGGSVSSAPGAPRLPREEVDACAYLVLSICVHDISEEMGAFYFAGLEAMYSVDDTIPSLFTPEAFDEYFGFHQDSGVTGSCVMRKGDMLLRNPLVWHAGTPNRSSATRYLPACIFAVEAKEASLGFALAEASQTQEF
jgi:hypothetical protein